MNGDFEEIERTFKETLGHGNFTLKGWTASIGISPPVAIRLRRYLGTAMTIMHLLMVLNFLKEYRVESAAALSFGYRSESTYEKYIWTGLKILDYNLPDVLSVVLFLHSYHSHYS